MDGLTQPNVLGKKVIATTFSEPLPLGGSKREFPEMSSVKFVPIRVGWEKPFAEIGPPSLPLALGCNPCPL
jgi:hypothetical protein